MMEIAKLFNKVKDNVLINTSYPLDKSIWKDYRVDKMDLFENVDELSLYFHIPFCKNLCKFCEYTRFNNVSKEDMNKYVDLLQDQFTLWIQNRSISKLYGLDIGGGTPTCLPNDAFERLMTTIGGLDKNIPTVDNFCKSIEGSFATIDDTKAKLIGVYGGFKRVSMGVQSTSKTILESNDREVNPLYKMQDVFNRLYKSGVEKINLDFMYGMNNQTLDSIKDSFKIIDTLQPQHVTVYETRYNSNNIAPQLTMVNKDNIYNQYSTIYDELINRGYKADFGANTFSKDDHDRGLSSYLYHRMFNFVPYKGFGISAQSCSETGISYNSGKNNKSYLDSLINGKIQEEYIYKLPVDELVGKYVSVGMYSGEFNLEVIKRLSRKHNTLIDYNSEIRYLLENEMITLKGNKVKVTQKGFKYYGAIATLFYGNESKKFILGDI